MKRLEVDFAYVAGLASGLAEKPYQNRRSNTPEELRELKYDGYRKIRFKEDETLWRAEGMPFQVQFYHLGYLFDLPVALNEFTATHTQEIPYVPEFFELQDVGFEKNFRASINYAGFKILHPLNQGVERYDELASFLGASYFRALGVGMHYGLSARGIAIDSGMSIPEEFPDFVDFWLGKPKGDSQSLTFFALLDGPRVTGAYQFGLKPGETTIVDIKTKLFFREVPQSIGIAPLTSMFWHGENGPNNVGDYRPESHDSDGLLIETSSERIWRPLESGPQSRLSYFTADDFSGFGLMQRDREFAHYQDLTAHYQDRPSVWVQPRGDWPAGKVKLIELPANKEFDDNIVAFWELTNLPEPGASVEYEYTLHWTKKASMAMDTIPMPVSTRIGEHLTEEGVNVFIVEFKSSAPYAEGWREQPELNISASSHVTVVDQGIDWNPEAERWRVRFHLTRQPDNSEPVELRCVLAFPSGARSETWTYQWIP